MPVLRKKLELGQLDYYEVHLSLVNCIVPEHLRMTPMEIRVLASFMSLSGHVAQHRFGTTGKKIIRGQLGLSHSGLSNYIDTLTKKRWLYQIGDIIHIKDILFPTNGEQEYTFKLINKDQPHTHTHATNGTDTSDTTDINNTDIDSTSSI